MEISKKKYTFVSKKKLIENYENILKRKDESIRSFKKESDIIRKERAAIKKENYDLKQVIKISDEVIADLITINKSIFNTEIDRIEKIKARTKKIKTKEKCENRILKIKEKYLIE